MRLCPRVIMLLRLAFLESERRTDILDGGRLARVYVFRNRLPMMHRAGWQGRCAASAIAFAWFVWDTAHPRRRHDPAHLLGSRAMSDEFDDAFKATFSADEFGPDEPHQGAKPNGAAPAFPRFLSAAEFVAGYVPQKPLIKAWDLKAGWLYSFTAPTGFAKTAIALTELLRLGRLGKRVVYLAGENPDDIRARMILTSTSSSSMNGRQRSSSSTAPSICTRGWITSAPKSRQWAAPT